MNQYARALALLLALLLTAGMLFSVFYIAHESDHDCCGEGCAVCAVLSACEDVLRKLLGFGLSVVFLAAVTTLLICFREGPITAARHFTLITLKVKLSA